MKPGTTPEAAVEEIAPDEAVDRNYLFRGDDNYRGGPVGLPLGAADDADIQNFADHVLRKESNLTSRYTSFSEEIRVARRFTSASDYRHVCKVGTTALRELEAQGALRIWYPDQVYAALRQGSRRLAAQASDVRTAMKRTSEVLIEGQMPSGILERAN